LAERASLLDYDLNRFLVRSEFTEITLHYLESGYSLEIMLERTFLDATKIEYQKLPSDKETPASFATSGIPWDQSQPPLI
jgi:hypothetical protein